MIVDHSAHAASHSAYLHDEKLHQDLSFRNPIFSC
jgi:hypothetical protein